MKLGRVAVLVKKTSYRAFVEEERDARVTGLLAKGDPTVRRMRRAHEDHESTVVEVLEALKKLGARTDVLVGSRSVITTPYDLVITIGGDGTLLNASQKLGPNTPLLGVNSSPDHSVGFFCAAKKDTVMETLASALDGTLKRTDLTRMRVELNGACIHNRVLNEALFCHASPAATSRYILRVTQGDGVFEEEEQKSSGMWIGPAAGSTAAQKSAGGRVQSLASSKVQFVVREPYTPAGQRLQLTCGLVDESGFITLRNKMREAKIFLDGHYNVHDATIGDVILMRRSDESLTVLGLTRNGDVDATRGGQSRKERTSERVEAPRSKPPRAKP
jgi:NAD+ kinase